MTMFNSISNKKILVSGPQRSGTRICARMVANDTGLSYIDETDIPEFFRSQNREYVINTIQDMVDGNNIISDIHCRTRDQKDFVLHCPPLMSWIHLIKGVFIIIVRRSIEEIDRSIERISWKDGLQELEYNKIGYTRFGEPKSGCKKTNKSLAKLKYEFWDNYQRGCINDYLEIEYNSLSEHPMWISPEERRDFKWWQVSKDLLF